MAKKKVEEKQPVIEYNEKITNLPEAIPQEGVEEITIAKKLLSLYNLQQICSQIDKIRVVRGELPNEVSDLEDALEGMNTRIEKHKEELEELQQKIVAQDVKMKEANGLIKRYEEQQNNVRNNREYESLTKEIDYQRLEIQVAEKHKVKFGADVVLKAENIAEFEENRKEMDDILTQKKNELSDIIADTKKEEQELVEKSEELKKNVDHRLLNAFERIRNNARNGLAIVLIERDACGGCFSKIPPQRQLDIRLHKKIIVCEACGRIFIDQQLVESQNS
jgi:predicted  nucleic acid-binding Zn-ribbon protein